MVLCERVKLLPEDYRSAARERVEAARELYQSGRYPEAIYFAGVATESILRAYRARVDSQFDARHDLPELLRASGLEGFVPEGQKRQVGAALGDIWTRWKNDYRYAPLERLKTSFRKSGLFVKIKGDAFKENARVAVESSLKIVGIGDARWARHSSTS